MTARALMIQGTASHVGKSLLTAAVCRLFARRGVRVVPFKAQNMSNNAAVCRDGAEIGRAQALQALAAGVPPTADMNPVLLKPETDMRSQVVVHGRPWQRLAARDYFERKRQLWGAVTESLDRLRSAFDLIVIEGAGSPVELNLRAGDVVNMAVARYARSPVLLAGNIDMGGVFAQLLGTLGLLEPDERRFVRGLIVNKFRGDPALFADGVRILEDRGGVPVLGVVPFLPDLGLPEEDAVAVEAVAPGPVDDNGAIDIAVIRLPRIANFDDFDPLVREPGIRVRFVDSPARLGRPHAVIIPGTKSTVADLRWLHARGLADAIVTLAAAGTPVVGICGGYQMLGRLIRDPDRVEADVGEVPGLGLLDVETTFAAVKATHQVRAVVQGGPGWLAAAAGQTLTGYEIHMGQTPSPAPWLTIADRGGAVCDEPDGTATAGGRVWGCYLHGLFVNDCFRRAWLSSLASGFGPPAGAVDAIQVALDRLADAVGAAIPIERLERIVSEGVPE
jgi:adenosylcobyric acid synthase